MANPSCAACLKRPRDRGGNDGCPLALASSRADFERGIRPCRYFKGGDRRTQQIAAVLPASLF